MPTLLHEKRHGFLDGKVVCGVDEAGRGPLAGPVVAAAVILPLKLPGRMKSGIRDSKKMSPEERDALFDPIHEHCKVGVGEASVEEIDRLNILWASMLAMTRAMEALVTTASLVIDMALIDGNRCPPKANCAMTPIIGGDDRSLSIAAASIVAKVTRDRFMKYLALEHPGYGWETNMGYGTPAHCEALDRFGTTRWHRTSFAPVRMRDLFDDPERLERVPEPKSGFG